MTVISQRQSHGSSIPLVGTQRTTDRETLGGGVADTSKLLGRWFMPWQRHVSDVSLEIDSDTGLLAYDDVTIVVGRQEGKSWLSLPVITHRALAPTFLWYGPQTILYIAQTASETRKRWADKHLADLKKHGFGDLFTARLRLAEEAVLWNNGSLYAPSAATERTGGTGDTTDLGWVDEGWAHTVSVERSLSPTMLTRQSAQFWCSSMVRTSGH